MSKLKRETKETQILSTVRIGTGEARIKVGDQFLAHMVETLARYANLDIEIEATADLHHHLVEDVAITLGLALADEVGQARSKVGNDVVNGWPGKDWIEVRQPFSQGRQGPL